jgi:hypothetical protein
LERESQREMGSHVVHVSATYPLANEITRSDQIADDPLCLTLSDVEGDRDVA